jgi:hypothetical protein
MAAPTYVAEYESDWNTTTTPKTQSVTVSAGDVIVIVAVTADQSTMLNTPTGGGLTYVPLQSIAVGTYCAVSAWGVEVAAGQTFTLSCSRSATANMWGFNCIRFSGSDGIGASFKTNVASGAPTLNATADGANSAWVVVNGDWNAADGASRTWRTNAGALTERTYFRDSSNYTVYGGYHADAGSATTDAVGLSAPSGQKYAIIAVEVLGSASGSQTVVANLLSTTTTIFNPAVAPGSVTVVVNLLATTSTIFNPTVVQIVAVPILSVSSTIFEPTVVPGTATVVAQLLTTSTSVFEPTVTTFNTVVAPVLSAPSIIFEPTVTVGPVEVIAPILTTTSTIFEPAVVNSGAVTIDVLSVPSTIFEPSVVRLLQEISVQLLSVPSTIFSPTVTGGGAPAVALLSIADQARVNMLIEVGGALDSNSDLMRQLIVDVDQTTITVTSASAGNQLMRYMMSLR